MRTKLSPWAHSDHGGHGSGPNDHSSVTARSQLSHGEVTAQSRHLQYDHGSVTDGSQLNHGPARSRLSYGWLWPFWSPWAHGEHTVSSDGGQFFFLMGSGKTGNLFSLVLCSLWWVQVVGYVLAYRSYSFVCTLHHLIIIIVQTLSEDIELIKCLSDIICRVCE